MDVQLTLDKKTEDALWQALTTLNDRLATRYGHDHAALSMNDYLSRVVCDAMRQRQSQIARHQPTEEP